MAVMRSRVRAPIPESALGRRRFLSRLGAALAGLAVLGRPQPARASTAGTDAFLGEIMLFAGNFAPNGWAVCNGQLLAINTNIALFSLLGTTYGGNGSTTFALPDLRGRAPIHFGQGAGLSNYSQGEIAGTETHVLAATEMPAHTHTAYADAANGTTESPAGALPARNPAGIPAYGTGSGATLSASHLASAGGGQPHNNMPPYLVLNYCICIQGIYPSRS